MLGGADSVASLITVNEQYNLGIIRSVVSDKALIYQLTNMCIEQDACALPLVVLEQVADGQGVRLGVRYHLHVVRRRRLGRRRYRRDEVRQPEVVGDDGEQLVIVADQSHDAFLPDCVQS